MAIKASIISKFIYNCKRRGRIAAAFRRNPAPSIRFKIRTLPHPIADLIFIQRYSLVTLDEPS